MALLNYSVVNKEKKLGGMSNWGGGGGVMSSLVVSVICLEIQSTGKLWNDVCTILILPMFPLKKIHSCPLTTSLRPSQIHSRK